MARWVRCMYSKAVLATLFSLIASATVDAQQTYGRHYRHFAELPPGVVGRDQLTRGGPLEGYFQPVRLVGPAGSSIALIAGEEFQASEPSPVTVGMLIGQVYRFRVSGIPGREGFEVYPTVEVINRLYPPPGKKAGFPIPIHLTEEELRMAVDGLFVTRVIYLEDPATAFPRREDPGEQRYFEVGQQLDPLVVADDLGRPMAILRMGSRIPDGPGAWDQFAYGSPPTVRYRPQPGPEMVMELKSVQPGRNVEPKELPSDSVPLDLP